MQSGHRTERIGPLTNVSLWPIVPIQHLNRKPPFAPWKNIRLRSTTKESVMESTQHREPWNKGKLVGQKPPLKPKDIWAIRIQLQNAHRVRDFGACQEL